MEHRGPLSIGWIIAIYGIAAAISAGAVLKGLSVPSDPRLLTGVLGLVITLVTFPICLYLTHDSSSDSKTESAIDADRLKSQFMRLTSAIEHLEETLVLSDDARRVVNRHKERALLRGAIDEDIKNQDYDAAMVLVRELAERFGYRADAEEFREKIQTARTTGEQQKVRSAIAHLDTLIANHDWDKALYEAARITRLHPESPLTDGLRHRVERAKQQHKLEIERRFLEAAREERVDEAMDMLREMDHLLTEQEAEQFRELARGVIGKARENLGVQFKLAVQDKSWDHAATIGQRIIEEFPNSRMASEVRDLIDTIRDRATSVQRR